MNASLNSGVASGPVISESVLFLLGEDRLTLHAPTEQLKTSCELHEVPVVRFLVV
jgi:hypothetical protein